NAYWATNTNRPENGDYTAVLRDDGVLAISLNREMNNYAHPGTSPYIWQTKTEWVNQQVPDGTQWLDPGQWMGMHSYIRTPDPNVMNWYREPQARYPMCAAFLQNDGNLVVFRTNDEPPYS